MTAERDPERVAGASAEQLLQNVHPWLFDGSLRSQMLDVWPRHPEAVRAAVLDLLPIGGGIRPRMPWPGLAQRTLLETLDRLGPDAVHETLGALEGRLGTPAIEREVARRLGRVSEEDARLGAGWSEILRTSTDPAARTRAAYALKDSVGGEDALRESLERDEDPGVRAACAAALGALHVAEAFEPLLTLLADDDDLGRRTAAFFGLSVLGDERALEPLVDVWLAAWRPTVTHVAGLPSLTDMLRFTHLSGLGAILDRVESMPKLVSSDRVRAYVSAAGLAREPMQGEILRRLAASPDDETLLAHAALYLRFVAEHKVSPIMQRAIVSAVHGKLPHLATGVPRTRAEKQFVKLAPQR